MAKTSKISKKDVPVLVEQATGMPASFADQVATTHAPVFAAAGVTHAVAPETQREHFSASKSAGVHKLKGDHPMATRPARYGSVPYAGPLL